MDCLSKYDDPTQYSLISERQNYENGYNIQTQILKEIDTDIQIKRTIKSPYPGLNNNQVDVIQARSKWNRFNLGKDDLDKISARKPYKIAKDTFMEYNMNYLNSKHNIGVIKKMLNDPYNVEKIKINSDGFDTDEDLDRFIYKIYNSLDDNDNMISYKNYKYITRDYENVRDDPILKPKKKEETNKNIYRPQRTNSAYVPSFRRDNSDQDQNNNTLVRESDRFIPRHRRGMVYSGEDTAEEFTVRISNLPEEPEFQDVLDWLKNIDIGRFKLILPKNRRTNKNNNYGFVKYFSKDFADLCIEKVHRQSYDHNIVNAEYAKPRK
mgnify:FL=1